MSYKDCVDHYFHSLHFWQLERYGEDLEWRISDYLTVGNVLGEINFLIKEKREKTVRAETPLTVFRLDNAHRLI